MYKVMMRFKDDSNWYFHSAWENRNKANEVAMTVRDERDCEVNIEEIE